MLQMEHPVHPLAAGSATVLFILQTMFEPASLASYCSRIQGQGLWKWEAGADVEDPPFPRGDREKSFQQAKLHLGGSTGEQLLIQASA